MNRTCCESEKRMAILPVDLQAYATFIVLALLAFDGFLLGAATKRAVISVILVIAGLMLAAFIGLSIPFLSTSYIVGNVANFVASQVKTGDSIFFTLPIFWIIGFALGLWKG